jgi:hypothetical protein
MTHVSRNVKHPCSEVALSPEKVPVFQDAEERVLHQVFAQFLAPVHSVKETVQLPFIALKEQPQTAHVAVADCHH